MTSLGWVEMGTSDQLLRFCAGRSCRRTSSWKKSWCASAAATSERRRSWPRRCCSRKAPIGAATSGDTRHQRWPPVQKGPHPSPRKYRHRRTSGRPSGCGAMMTERAPSRNDRVRNRCCRELRTFLSSSAVVDISWHLWHVPPYGSEQSDYFLGVTPPVLPCVPNASYAQVA